jgi:hypothetical protein
MKATNLHKILDFENNDYLYHETSKGFGKQIMEEGLLINGTNILNTNNILFTTTLPLTEEMTSDPIEFSNFLNQEKSLSALRDVSEMVIIYSPKEYDYQIVSPFNNFDSSGQYYEGIVEPQFIIGVINLRDLTFTPNPECEYADEFIDIDVYHKHK